MSEDYPGVYELAANMRRRWPWLSKEQAWVLACIKIRPDRNREANHVGWDAMRRPLIESNTYGREKRRFATLRNGNPTEPKAPLTLFSSEAEVQSTGK